MSSEHRQRQLPSVRPGTFIRASAPRLSTSCSGTIASAAADGPRQLDQCRRCVGATAFRPFQIPPEKVPLGGGQFFVPLARRGIVVGAGVYDRIGDVVVRQMRVIRMSVEAELQHPCPRQTELVAQCGNVRRDQPQILGNERQTSHFSPYGLEELASRTGHPLAGLCR